MNIAARLNGHLNLETVLTTGCEETAHALKVPATAVRPYDPKQDILYTFDQACHFTEDELSLLTGLADQAAQAITNAVDGANRILNIQVSLSA